MTIEQTAARSAVTSPFVRDVAQRVREQGLHKVASTMYGIDAASLPTVGAYLGTKLVAQHRKHAQIRRGLEALDLLGLKEAGVQVPRIHPVADELRHAVTMPTDLGLSEPFVQELAQRVSATRKPTAHYADPLFKGVEKGASFPKAANAPTVRPGRLGARPAAPAPTHAPAPAMPAVASTAPSTAKNLESYRRWGAAAGAPPGLPMQSSAKGVSAGAPRVDPKQFEELNAYYRTAKPGPLPTRPAQATTPAPAPATQIPATQPVARKTHATQAFDPNAIQLHAAQTMPQQVAQSAVSGAAPGQVFGTEGVLDALMRMGGNDLFGNHGNG